MKKTKQLLLMLTVLAMLLFTACGNNESNTKGEESATDDTKINIAALKGPTGMGMVNLMEDNKNYTFTLAPSPDDIVGEIISGKFDIAAVPTNLAATLYQKTQGNVEVAAINTLSVLYILEKDNSIETVADLSGKRILSAGQGTTAEYVLNYVIQENGLYLGENVVIEYASEHAEVATKAQTGEYDAVVLPEPFVTSLLTQDSDFHVALDLTEEWQALDKGDLAMGCLIVQKDFAKNHPDALVAFLDDYAKSVAFVNKNPKEAATLMEKHDIMKATIGEKAIPNCNIVCITGEDMKTSMSSFLKIMYDANPQSIGGTMPKDDFYFVEK